MTANAFRENSPVLSPVDPRIARSRAKLIAAATEILVESGPAALTVDAVADRSGVAKSTLYRHWPSRTALMIDVLRENMPCTPEFDPAAGFEQCMRDYMRALADTFSDPEWARILPALFALKEQFPEVGSMSEADHEEKVAVLRSVLEQGVRKGLLPTGLDADTVATMLVGPMMMCALTGQTDRVRDIADYTLDRFLESYRD